MPCACKVPVVQYPETAEWGPLLWDILHGLAEQSGKQIRPEDEQRGWVTLLESIASMLPCEVCRKHYSEYLREHPVRDFILKEPYGKMREFVRTWLWNLHNEVNQGNDKPVFPLIRLLDYKEIPVAQRLKQLSAPIQRAIVNNGVRLFQWKAFERAVKVLLSL